VANAVGIWAFSLRPFPDLFSYSGRKRAVRLDFSDEVGQINDAGEKNGLQRGSGTQARNGIGP
jgi:hypothetical protein